MFDLERHINRCVVTSRQQEVYQLVGQAKRRATKIRHIAVGGGIDDRFISNFEKCRPEVTDDVISGGLAKNESFAD